MIQALFFITIWSVFRYIERTIYNVSDHSKKRLFPKFLKVEFWKGIESKGGGGVIDLTESG